MEDHQFLANFIKDVHIGLRLKSRKIGFEAAWENHCKNEDLLQKYASAMQQLATMHWDKNNGSNSDVSRIYWVVKQCEEYFYGEGRQKWPEKERIMAARYELHFEVLKMECSSPHLALLDVGSCYNPFNKFPLFNVTALDLAPATEDVIKCDFLLVSVGNQLIISDSECRQLPKNTYDIVVFSLFLEYLPSPRQRFNCCLKAYNVLKPNGILFILTPDSKHATANSKLYKNWKWALASMGFLRTTYEKLKHLHCMMFRKCSNPNVAKHWLYLEKINESNREMDELMAIPQDNNEYNERIKDLKENDVRNEEDNKIVADVFSCLTINDDIFN